jgi:hypothetical protein
VATAIDAKGAPNAARSRKAAAVDASDAPSSAPSFDARVVEFLGTAVWRDAMMPTIAIRLTLLAAGFILVPIFRPDVFNAADPLAIWNRWDVPHYLEVARAGYADPNRSVVFPLFPVLINLVSVVLPALLAGMLISLVATVAAAAGLYQLVRLDHSRSTARAAVLAMNVFPTAYWLSAAYSDAVFLAFVVWAFLTARREDWEQAGVLALLAGATRVQGAFLAPALVVEYLMVYRRPGRQMLWLVLGLGGLALYLGINQVTYGNPLYFVEIQKATFFLENVPPWTVIQRLVTGVATHAHDETWVTIYLAPLVAYLVLGLTTAWTILTRPRRSSYVVYTGLTLLTLLTLSWPISMPRYLLGVAPLFVGLGILGRRPGFGSAWLVVSIILLGAFMTLLLIGHWAF